MSLRTIRTGSYRLLYDVRRDPDPLPAAVAERIARSSDHVVAIYRALQREGMVPQDREAFCAVYLDARHRPIAFHVVSIGTCQSSLVSPRETFRPAVAVGAAAVVVAHHHPSGDETPSAEDRAITTRLGEAGDLLGIKVLDHVVIGSQRYYSFAEGRAFPLGA